MTIKTLPTIVLLLVSCFCYASERGIDVSEICPDRLFDAYEETVLEAYIAYYGRPADPEGLEYWANRLRNEGGNLSSIIDAFATSREFEDRFGHLTNEQLVTKIYAQLFDRKPETEGHSYYVGELNVGSKNLQTIALDVLYGAQNDDAVTVRNRQSLSKRYVVGIEEGSAQDLSAEQLAETIQGVNASEVSLINACLQISSTENNPFNIANYDRPDASDEDLTGLWIVVASYNYKIESTESARSPYFTERSVTERFSLSIQDNDDGTIDVFFCDQSPHQLDISSGTANIVDYYFNYALTITSNTSMEGAVLATPQARLSGRIVTLTDASTAAVKVRDTPTPFDLQDIGAASFATVIGAQSALHSDLRIGCFRHVLTEGRWQIEDEPLVIDEELLDFVAFRDLPIATDADMNDLPHYLAYLSMTKSDRDVDEAELDIMLVDANSSVNGDGVSGETVEFSSQGMFSITGRFSSGDENNENTATGNFTIDFWP